MIVSEKARTVGNCPFSKYRKSCSLRSENRPFLDTRRFWTKELLMTRSMIDVALPEAVSAAIAAGVNAVRAIRQAKGYSIEDLAVTCGLAIEEIAGIENGDDSDPSKLRRIASALGLPETTLTTS
jgi:hypothetical protein